MPQSNFIIEDLKYQINRLSEERAIFYALAHEKEEKNNQLQENIDVLVKQLESLKEKEQIHKEELEHLRSQNSSD